MLASPEAEAASLPRLQGGQAYSQRRALSPDALKQEVGPPAKYASRMRKQKRTPGLPERMLMLDAQTLKWPNPLMMIFTFFILVS